MSDHALLVLSIGFPLFRDCALCFICVLVVNDVGKDSKRSGDDGSTVSNMSLLPTCSAERNLGAYNKNGFGAVRLGDGIRDATLSNLKMSDSSWGSAEHRERTIRAVLSPMIEQRALARSVFMVCLSYLLLAPARV